jgi:hypothetical protein
MGFGGKVVRSKQRKVLVGGYLMRLTNDYLQGLGWQIAAEKDFSQHWTLRAKTRG